ncbi:MAG: YbaK/EbsC family protein [Candidatus Krumholzibacteria bacterium]|nr:YbaK/EbsC family protein [Candidatus Krumholzibacteria bacterium]
MPVKKLKEFLDSNKVKYVTMSHSPAYTAQEIAAMAHIPGKELAKTVIVKVDGEMAMAVLPASYKVDFKLLKKAAKAKKVELAGEKEFKDLFSECEVGAMPPFGNLYDMNVFVAESLAEGKEIAFNAGSHTELIKMSYADFEKLAEPTVLKYSIKD